MSVTLRSRRAPALGTKDAGPAPARSDARLAADGFLAEVLAGLAAPRKRLPCKYFYDDRGSALFERICDLPEYYLTRTELEILGERAGEMADCLGPRALLIELGSGSARKTRLLLHRLAEPAGYVPVDIDRALLEQTTASLRREFPGLPIRPLAADFTRDFELPPGLPAGRRVVFFPGSTVGNLEPLEALGLLARIGRLAGAGGGLLIGIDLKKERHLLEAAYNDRQGVTAEFNLNLLRRLRDELGAELDLAAFRHQAFYNAREGRIEMHLASTIRQRIRVGAREFDLQTGESIHTENAYKYDPREFAELAAAAGLSSAREWTDAQQRFAVQLYTVRPAGAGDPLRGKPAV